MKKTIFLILIELLAVGAFAAERVISLSPALTELIWQLGCGNRQIARSQVCDYPENVRALPVAGRFADPDVETILALKPTLLLTNDLINPGIIRIFRNAGIQTEMMQCRTIAEYRSCVEKTGALLNATQAARQELARIDAEQTAKHSALKLHVLWVVWDSPLMIAGKSSLPDELIRQAGAINVAGEVQHSYFKCSFDWLLERKIDVIVWMASPNGWMNHRFWSKLKAVQDNRILTDLDPDLVQRPGPRIFDGIRLLRKKLETLDEK